MEIKEEEFLSCCGSTQFAQHMVKSSPFNSLEDAIPIAQDIWFNKVDVNGWLQAFSAHPQIGDSPTNHSTSAQWSKGEQSTALATATSSSLQELCEWNIRYRQKFGFVFLICASGRSTAEVLGELKRRYPNRPIIEFEIAAQEQMKITELRLAKLFSTKKLTGSANDQHPAITAKRGEDRVSIIGGHLTAVSEASQKESQIPTRTRPPITTHVLDVSRGSPASGIEVHLEVWKGTGTQSRPFFHNTNPNGWTSLGSSVTNEDGRSGQLMSINDTFNPGVYRISFNTEQYSPGGFFPYVSIIFEVKDSQIHEHFHVPLLFSPFSFTTYRGS